MKTQYEYNKTWRRRHPEIRHQGKRRYYERHRETQSNKQHTRQRWTPEEIASIVAPNRPTDPQLARLLGRSVQAIQIKRSRIRDFD